MLKGTCIRGLRSRGWVIEKGRRVNLEAENELLFFVATEGCNIGILVRAEDLKYFVKLDNSDNA